MADDSDATRRTILQGLAAGAGVAGLSATGSAKLEGTRTDEPAAVPDPERFVRETASETIGQLERAGLLPNGFSFTELPADRTLHGGEGVSTFRLDGEPADFEPKRYLLATRQTPTGHVRLWIDRDTSTAVADVRTADGDRRFFTEQGEISDVTQAGCSNFCNPNGCEYEEYVVTVEIGGDCFIDYEATTCGC